MFTSLSIENFRCFRDLKIGSLGRINLISGMNNIGKSALLEAIHILSLKRYDLLEYILYDQKIFRNYDGNDYGDDKSNFRSWLFYNRQTSTRVLISGCLADNNQKGIEITLDRMGGIIATPEPGIPPGENNLARINRHGESYTPAEVVRAYSELAKDYKGEELLDSLNVFERRLKSIEVLAIGTPRLYGDINIGEKIPMQQMGEGMNRMQTLLLGIAAASDSIMLIDEIENGFHYSTLVKVWYTIHQAAKKNNVQVFATTHSWECIRAAYKAFSEEENFDTEFRYHRLDRNKPEDDIRVVTYDQETLEGSFKLELEVR